MKINEENDRTKIFIRMNKNYDEIMKQRRKENIRISNE